MHLLNFSHPLTEQQYAQLEALLDASSQSVREVMPHFDEDLPLMPQVQAIVDSLGISAHNWQTLPFVIVLPGFAPAAACLLTELHGRMGYFPRILRLRPRPDSPVRIYDVCEVIALAAARNHARARRTQQS